MMIRRVACSALVILFAGGVSRGEDYDSYFDYSWHVATAARTGGVTLLSDPNYPCHVKAYGWKLIGTERRRSKDTPWYSLGEVYQKWGYKLVVKPNPSDSNVAAMLQDVKLKSEDGFVLDTAFDIASSPTDLLIRGEEPKILQGTSSFNLSSKSGEGSPSSIDFTIICRRIVPGR